MRSISSHSWAGGRSCGRSGPSALNIGLDLDLAVIRQWQACTAGNDDAADPIAGNDDDRPPARVSFIASTARNGDASPFQFQHGDGVAFLKSYSFTGPELVYCDPPYMHETRGRTDLYRFEMDDRQHRELLQIIRRLPCRVMISGYWTETYAAALKDWNTTTFQAMTRAGRPATEWLWFNFPEPVALHDYRYLGEDFRERERIKRSSSAG